MMDVADVIAVMSVYFPLHAYASHESCAMLHPPALRFSHHTCYFVVDKVDVSERLPAASITVPVYPIVPRPAGFIGAC